MLLLSHNEKPWILEICGGNVCLPSRYILKLYTVQTDPGGRADSNQDSAFKENPVVGGKDRT